jgi:hypothetical protein
MTVDQPATEQKRRRSARAKVLLSASLEYSDRVLPVVLRNLSEYGALIEVTGIVANDCECRLRRKDLCVEGHVAWTDGKLAGIAFTAGLSPEAVMEHVARPTFRQSVGVAHRRPGVTQRMMSPQERRWLAEMSRK